ncbi:unnamed protein product [Phaeothamnion confervicola]
MPDTLPRIYKSILVTGGAGFIASRTLCRLVQAYPECMFINIDSLTYAADLGRLESTKDCSNYKFYQMDIIDSDAVSNLFEAESASGRPIDVVMHFAAETHVDNSFGNSFSFTKTNVLGTHVLLEAVKKFGIKLFLHVSTDEVHGPTGEGETASVESVLAPTNPYSASKSGAELLVRAYQTSFGIPVIITRGNNVFGNHQHPEKIIPKFICQILTGRTITIHGDGSHQRNYLFVDDVAAAFDTILHCGEIGHIYNIGGSTERTNLEIAQAVAAGTNKRCVVEFVDDRPFNDLRYSIDSSALKALGWSEQVPWEDGLRMTIEWYQNHAYSEQVLERVLTAHPSN